MDSGFRPGVKTTSGALAISNLEAQIAGQESAAREGRLSLSARVGWIEAIAERGHVLGRIAEVAWASGLAEALRREQPDDPDARMAAARAKARFHLFADALAELDEAARKGADPTALAAERAAILQAVGEYVAALPLLRAAVERRADFASIGALAVFHAERGEMALAEPYFNESRAAYRGVSPIPLARLEFQRGHMGMAGGDLERARASFGEAVRLLPAYAPAQGHLAEVEAALGDVESALARLLPLTRSSDDPDYPAALAHILAKAGRAGEAARWRSFAAARYEDLIARHPDAFADHAAAFWLEHRGDPHRALALARRNLEIRRTPRARKLVERAANAVAALEKEGIA
jgi:tetratricopeptide (TPR) repeat protein